jgi:hypothetical protein
MNPADLFVGAVSTIVGILGIAAGVWNWEKCYQPAKVRWLVNTAGRTGARWLYIGGGSFFVVLGIAIACGFALPKQLGVSPSTHSARRAN